MSLYCGLKLEMYIVLESKMGWGEACVLYAISYPDIDLLRKIALAKFWLLAGWACWATKMANYRQLVELEKYLLISYVGAIPPLLQSRR